MTDCICIYAHLPTCACCVLDRITNIYIIRQLPTERSPHALLTPEMSLLWCYWICPFLLIPLITSSCNNNSNNSNNKIFIAPYASYRGARGAHTTVAGLGLTFGRDGSILACFRHTFTGGHRIVRRGYLIVLSPARLWGSTRLSPGSHTLLCILRT